MQYIYISICMFICTCTAPTGLPGLIIASARTCVPSATAAAYARSNSSQLTQQIHSRMCVCK